MAEIIIVSDAAQGGRLAATRIARLVTAKPDAVLGLATGATPLSTWDALAELGLDLSAVRGFALDEYIGLPNGHPQSYRGGHHRACRRTAGPEPEYSCTYRATMPARSTSAGSRYETAIREAGGVDLQVLGIGRTGHIGFNEPGSSLASRTRIKTLTEQTRRDNSRFFASLDEVPQHCLTQGLGTILEARELVLLAWGEAKAEALAAAVEGPVTASLPGSVIQLHPAVTVIADDPAASQLRFADYYRDAWRNRPDWARD